MRIGKENRLQKNSEITSDSRNEIRISKYTSYNFYRVSIRALVQLLVLSTYLGGVFGGWGDKHFDWFDVRSIRRVLSEKTF